MSEDLNLAVFVLLRLIQLITDLALLQMGLVLTTPFETVDVRFSLLETRWSFTFSSAIRRTLVVQFVLLFISLEVSFRFLSLKRNTVHAFTTRCLLSSCHLLLVRKELRALTRHVSRIEGLLVHGVRMMMLVLSTIRILLFK